MGLFVTLALLFIYCHASQGTYVVSWGGNSFGQLGIGTTTASPITTPTVVDVYTSLNVANIRVGLSTHFAMLADGNVYCAGNNIYGQLGINSVQNQNRPVRNYLAFGLDAFPIGPQTIAYNATTKEVFGWGLDSGYVQTNSYSWNQLTPVKSQNTLFVASVVSISTGWSTNFVTINGGTYAAGKVIVYSGYTTDVPAKFGTNTTTDQPDFLRMSFWDNVPLQKLFPSSASHVCGYAKNFSLYCWGRNSVGQVGLGHTNDASTPVLVSFFDDNGLYPAQVRTGDAHTVALTCGGKVYTWGSNVNGNLGIGSKDSSAHSTPTLVPSLSSLNIIEIVSSMNTVWARNSTNHWHVWGSSANNFTLLGTSDITSPTVNTYFNLRGLSRIASNSKSTFAFAWIDGNPPTQINSDCPPMRNECLLGSSNCALNAKCMDTERAYKCLCNTGFYGDGVDVTAGGTGCIDINECAQTQTGCVSGTSCDNQLGGFRCSCPDGYQGDGKINGTGCSDINECAEGGWCPPNTVCTNTIGSFLCNCSKGYQQIGVSPCGVICTDIDECNTQNPCNARASCSNTGGNYTCKCLPGYSGTTCQDINECTTGAHNCALQSYCVNLAGSFKCSCPTGFEGNAISTVYSTGTGCLDINECQNSSACHSNATCANAVGSYACTCKSGFTGNGFTCADINECLNASNKCVASTSNCTNTLGSYSCACISGYSGNGVKSTSGGTGCSDINECTAGTYPCDSAASCTNTVGSYYCNCTPGLLGSGKKCYSVNCSVGYYPNSSSTCDKCPAGTYNNQTNIEKCAACPAGTYSTSIGQTSISTCKSCGLNTYSTSGSTKCTTCQPGSVSSSYGASSCSLCPAGQYGFQGSCKPCGAGYYSTTPGSADCLPCPPGTFANSTTATQCYPCQAGTFSKGRASDCQKCAAGTYTSTTGQYYCQTCKVGSSTQGLLGATSCTTCAPGSYSSLAGSASCSSCPKGTFAAQNGSDACIGCAPGSFQNTTGQSSCQLCSGWQYADTYASVSCSTCYQGFAGEAEFGSKACLACPPGTYRDGTAAVCLPCYAGSATELAGQAHCSYCMGGFYAKKCGATTCSVCLPGSYSVYGPSGRTSCAYCPLGQDSFGTAYFCYA